MNTAVTVHNLSQDILFSLKSFFPATELQSANGKYTRTIVRRIMTTKIVQMTDPLLFYIQIPVKRELNIQRCKIHL